jgi:hypothetical protein
MLEQPWLGIERIDLAGASVHEQGDHRPGLGWMMRFPGVHGVVRPPTPPIQIEQCERPDPHARLRKPRSAIPAPVSKTW